MRIISIPILLAAVLIAAACVSAEKPPVEKPAPAGKSEALPEEPEKKPEAPDRPPAPAEPAPEISDDMKRGVIPGGGADSYDGVLAALEKAVEKKDADALWKLLASEPRREITREMAWFKLGIIAKPEDGKVDFLGGKASVEEVCEYPVQKILLNAAAAGLGCEAQGRLLWYRYTTTITGFLEDLGKFEKLAETVEKDGRRADIFVRLPDGIDVHLWFVKEGGRWFFHSPREGVPPEVEWSIPKTVAPGEVKVDISTPAATVRTFALATAAANLEASVKCLSGKDQKTHGLRNEQIKSISAGMPDDQEYVYSTFYGLPWRDLKRLPASELAANARVSEEDLLSAEVRARPLVEAELEEISNDGKMAVVEANFPEAAGYPPEKFTLVKEADGWKLTIPEREEGKKGTGEQESK